MSIWKQPFTLEGLNNTSKNTLVEHLDIEYTDFGPDFLVATMPVDHRTKQPAGLLHGGASVVLAESVGSVASFLCLESMEKMAVGLEINATHLRAVRSGLVTAVCRPARVGRSVHVWNIEISDDQGRLSCVSRLTVSIIDRK
ncbi:MAG: hotdog fold thioesterase [Bacteroidota bacterium]